MQNDNVSTKATIAAVLQFPTNPNFSWHPHGHRHHEYNSPRRVILEEPQSIRRIGEMFVEILLLEGDYRRVRFAYLGGGGAP